MNKIIDSGMVLWAIGATAFIAILISPLATRYFAWLLSLVFRAMNVHADAVERFYPLYRATWKAEFPRADHSREPIRMHGPKEVA